MALRTAATPYRRSVLIDSPGPNRRGCLHSGTYIARRLPDAAAFHLTLHKIARLLPQRATTSAVSPRIASETEPHTARDVTLDEGTYLGSVRTMYRLLAADGQARERRNQLTHPAYAKPELLATGPNEVWSWDISVPQQAA